MAKKLAAVFAIQIVSSLAFAAWASAQTMSLVWDAYADIANMISLYRYLVTIDGTPTPLAVVFDRNVHGSATAVRNRNDAHDQPSRRLRCDADGFRNADADDLVDGRRRGSAAGRGFSADESVRVDGADSNADTYAITNRDDNSARHVLRRFARARVDSRDRTVR